MTRAVLKRPQHPPTIAASPEMGSRIPASRIFRNRAARRIYRSRITTCRIAAADLSPDGGTRPRLGKRSFWQCNFKKEWPFCKFLVLSFFVKIYHKWPANNRCYSSVFEVEIQSNWLKKISKIFKLAVFISFNIVCKICENEAFLFVAGVIWDEKEIQFNVLEAEENSMFKITVCSMDNF